MTVREFIKALSAMPPDAEVMTQDHEFTNYFPTPAPKLETIRLTHNDILRKDRWEWHERVSDGDMLAEKTVVSVG